MKTWWLAGSDLTQDRGVRFGMSVFETVAVVRGKPLFLEGHLDRLRIAANDLLEIDAGAFRNAIASVLTSGLETGVARVYVTAGPGGLMDPCLEPAVFVIAESCEILAGPGGGISLEMERAPLATTPGGWKTGNYWQNVRALRSARSAGCDEAVVCSPGGEVLGCATGNLFAIIDDGLVTPALESGARPGVVREWVIARTGASECRMDPMSLIGAEECFVTNSRIGIASVARLSGRQLPQCGLAAKLAGQYLDEVLSH